MVENWEKLQEMLREKLKEKGLKVTQQRLLLFETFAENRDRHLSVDDVYEIVREEHPEIGLATVYRTVQLLREIQLLDRIILDDGCVRYEIRCLTKGNAHHHHHHLICRSCGKVLSFRKDLLDGLEDRIEQETGFHVLDHELKFYGQCKECARRSADKK